MLYVILEAQVHCTYSKLYCTVQLISTLLQSDAVRELDKRSLVLLSSASDADSDSASVGTLAPFFRELNPFASRVLRLNWLLGALDALFVPCGGICQDTLGSVVSPSHTSTVQHLVLTYTQILDTARTILFSCHLGFLELLRLCSRGEPLLRAACLRRVYSVLLSSVAACAQQARLLVLQRGWQTCFVQLLLAPAPSSAPSPLPGLFSEPGPAVTGASPLPEAECITAPPASEDSGASTQATGAKTPSLEQDMRQLRDIWRQVVSTLLFVGINEAQFAPESCSVTSSLDQQIPHSHSANSGRIDSALSAFPACISSNF